MNSIQETLQKVKQGKVNSIYLLSGTEYYFIEQFKNTLIECMQEEISGDVITYDLKDTAIQDVLTDVETFPFFNNKKVVFAYHPVFLQPKPEKLNVSHDIDTLVKYIDNPTSYTILVLISPYEKLDLRKKITKLLKQHAEIVDCSPIKDRELRKWIVHIAKMNNITITKDACLLLESEFETNLYLLEKEIEKLAHYVGEKKEVTKEIVIDLIATSLTQNALDLVDTVLKGNLVQAIKIYKDLEKMKEDPIGMIALLSYQFRIIFQVKLLQLKGYSIQRIQGILNVHPYVVKLAAERSKQFSQQKLIKIINELTNTDVLMKQGKMNKEIAFEMLLYRLTT